MVPRGNNELVMGLKQRGLIRSDEVLQAFLKVDRGLFFPRADASEAYVDEPILCSPFHLSAPHIYAMALENLQLQPGNSFLNIASGSGYLSHLVAAIVGPYAANHAIERNQELVLHAQSVCSKSPALADLNFIKFHLGDAFTLSTAAGAHRYDRIYVGAGSPSNESFEFFRQLLQVGGRMIIPSDSDLLCVTRDSETVFTSRVIMHVKFLKLVEEPAVITRLMDKVDLFDNSVHIYQHQSSGIVGVAHYLSGSL